jgi:hypothetical protein
MKFKTSEFLFKDCNFNSAFFLVPFSRARLPKESFII